MNNRSDQQKLLDDVLAEMSPPDFRAALFGESLRLARRRRRGRQASQAGGVMAVVLLAAIFAWQSWPWKISVPQPTAKSPLAGSYRLVETQPLPAGAVVTTGQFAAVKRVSSAFPVTQVATTGGGFRLIDDKQLLSLVGSEPAILIRTGPDSEQLVFANPEDQKRFLGN